MAFRFVPMLLVGISLLISVSCGSEGSPTGPSTTTPPPAAAQNSGSVQIAVEPNPVPYSGKPITDVAGCANLNNTWYYDQVLKEVSGAEVKFTKRVDTFDGWPINDLSNLNIVVPANGTMKIATRWCSATSQEHNATSTFTGTDARGNPVTATSGVVRLLKP
jgi:hypothetical protein